MKEEKRLPYHAFAEVLGLFNKLAFVLVSDGKGISLVELSNLVDSITVGA